MTTQKIINDLVQSKIKIKQNNEYQKSKISEYLNIINKNHNKLNKFLLKNHLNLINLLKENECLLRNYIEMYNKYIKQNSQYNINKSKITILSEYICVDYENSLKKSINDIKRQILMTNDSIKSQFSLLHSLKLNMNMDLNNELYIINPISDYKEKYNELCHQKELMKKFKKDYFDKKRKNQSLEIDIENFNRELIYLKNNKNKGCNNNDILIEKKNNSFDSKIYNENNICDEEHIDNLNNNTNKNIEDDISYSIGSIMNIDEINKNNIESPKFLVKIKQNSKIDFHYKKLNLGKNNKRNINKSFDVGIKNNSAKEKDFFNKENNKPCFKKLNLKKEINNFENVNVKKDKLTIVNDELTNSQNQTIKLKEELDSLLKIKNSLEESKKEVYKKLEDEKLKIYSLKKDIDNIKKDAYIEEEDYSTADKKYLNENDISNDKKSKVSSRNSNF